MAWTAYKNVGVADLKQTANELATGLLADGKAGKLSKIGIDEVRAAMIAWPGFKDLDDRDSDVLEELTLRALIRKVG